MTTHEGVRENFFLIFNIINNKYAFIQISKRLDQPFMAIEHYTNGLQTFKNDITLLTGLARVYEVTYISLEKQFIADRSIFSPFISSQNNS